MPASAGLARQKVNANESLVKQGYAALARWGHLHRHILFPILTVIILRLWLAVWGVAAILMRMAPIIPSPPSLYHGVVRVPDQGLWLLLAPWQRWDAIWYLRIAEFGYSPGDASPSFFPLFPVLVRTLGILLGQNYLLAALTVSTLATVAAFALLYRFGEEILGEETAQRAVVYWAIFPTSFFMLGGYAEPLLAACAVASLYFAHKERWWLAGLAAAGATLTRPLGFLVLVPLALLAWQSHAPIRQRLVATLLPLLSVAAAMGAWMLYLQLGFHDALLWVHAEDTWQRVFVLPGQTMLWTAQNILTQRDFLGNNLIDLGLTSILLAASLAVVRRMPLSLSTYTLLMVMVPLLSFAQEEHYALAPMAAAGRRALLAFPAFLALAMVWKGRRQVLFWFLISGILQAILFLVFVQWIWVD